MTHTDKQMIGQFDDCPALNFGNLKPLPEGYAVIWCEGNEMFYGTKRGTDLELGGTWNRYWCRYWCFEHAIREQRKSIKQRKNE